MAETAAAFGMDVSRRREEPQAKRQQRTSATLRQEVVDLRERGLVPSAIADALNVSDRRVASILRELRAEAA